jgi:hypothetical protein
MEYQRAGGFHAHPFYPVILPIATRPWTRLRRELVPDDRHYFSFKVISEYKRGADMGDTIHSRQPIAKPGFANMIAVFRAFKAKPFTVRDRRFVQLVHEELARLWQRPLSPDPVDALPARLRDVVMGFRSGDSTKQVANRLGVSIQTVQWYSKVLHRQFQVSSRAELLIRLAPKRSSCRPRLGFECGGISPDTRPTEAPSP